MAKATTLFIVEQDEEGDIESTNKAKLVDAVSDV